MQNHWIGLSTGNGIHTAGTGSTANSQLPPNRATLTYQFMGSGFTANIWEHIHMDVDSRTITFADSSGLVYFSYNIPSIGAADRSFYMNSIGRALAYIRIGVDYDCPPPKPHVCYYDYNGRTINLNNGIMGAARVGDTADTGDQGTGSHFDVNSPGTNIIETGSSTVFIGD